MQFINWGEESPEQKAIRARYEQEALLEQAARIARARAGQAPGGSYGCLPAKGITFTSAVISPDFSKIRVFLKWNGYDENGKDKYFIVFDAFTEGSLNGYMEVKWNGMANKWQLIINDELLIAESDKLASEWNVVYDVPDVPFANPSKVECGNHTERTFCSRVIIDGSPVSDDYGTKAEAVVVGETRATIYFGNFLVVYLHEYGRWFVDLTDYGYDVYEIGSSLDNFPYGTHEVTPGVTVILTKGVC